MKEFLQINRFCAYKERTGIAVFVLEIFCKKAEKSFGHLEYCMRAMYKL